MYYDINAIAEGIKVLNVKLRTCPDRKYANAIIGIIHDMQWDLDKEYYDLKKIDYRIHAQMSHKLRLLEHRVIDKATALMKLEVHKRRC